MKMTTVAGYVLWALSCKRHAARIRAEEALALADDWTGAGAMVELIFPYMVNRRFSPDDDVRSLTRFIGEYVAATGATGIDSHDGETLIRAALGETVATQAIAKQFRVKLFLVAAIIHDLELSPDEVETIIAKAEASLTVAGHRFALLSDFPSVVEPTIGS